MTELVETIAKALVDDPERVVVTEERDRQGEVLQLQVAGSDMGKVIGIDMNGLMQSQASPLVLTVFMTVRSSHRTQFSPMKSRGRGSNE